ncbi:hypothetical protein LTR37_002392 [Vermiconidia calcicola]|uniref:Uncharacterized protein n=1 Tax=Vermiconidia calcicola TaxID=1690605 RepID=A0ACC3NSP4_9PEZI|nr:hypothetical protein LTR37_002392 [Vermiconidia calcicola]
MVCPQQTLEDVAPIVAPDFLGRRLRSLNETKLQLIKNWLHICSGYHGQDCQLPDNEAFQELREGAYFGVIDLEEMRLRCLPENAVYVALSYTWGPAQQGRFRTELKSVMTIIKRGGLSRHLDDLPKTIRDAINLVRNLGLRYLWVDSICTVQDMKGTWDRYADVRHLVYGNAFLTICAADGNDADAGLRALSQDGGDADAGVDAHFQPASRAPQCIESYSPNLQLMARYPLEAYVRQSKWHTRAWTFQERFLSKRCLVFVRGRVYYECRSTTMCEDVDLETPIAGSSLDFDQSSGQNFRKFSGNPVDAYRIGVTLYTARELSRSHDILAAFDGVGKLLCGDLGGESVYGLPNSHFDLALLLWEPQDAPKRRPPGPRESFPSWSWCGWDKQYVKHNEHTVPPLITEHLHDWLMEHTWISWYIRDGNGDLRLVWDPFREGSSPAHIKARLRGYPVTHAPSPGDDHYGRELPEDILHLPRNEFHRTIPEFIIQVRTLPPGRRRFVAVDRPDRSILQFWTWSAYFHLEGSKERPAREGIFSRRHNILDRNYSWAGSIVLNKNWKFDPRKPQHFIAISEAKEFESKVKIDNNYSLTGKEWPLFHVFLLGYDDVNQEPRTNAVESRFAARASAGDATAGDSRGSLVAYRVGLGKIYQEAFDQACDTDHQRDSTKTPHEPVRKQWREIVLG